MTDSISSRTTLFLEATVEEDPHELAVALARQRIRLTLASEDACYTGQLIAFSLLNLLIRLDKYCPAIQVSLPSMERHVLIRMLPSGDFADAVRGYLAPFPAASRISINTSEGANQPPGLDAETCLQIEIAPRPAVGRLTVWAHGWLVYLNAAPKEVGRREEPNPVGPSVAAAMAAAEVFKRLLAGRKLRPGLKVVRTGRIVFSAYDYRLSEGPNPSLPPAVDLTGVGIVGLGGIGAALVSAASSLPDLKGQAVMVDGDDVDITNLNRQLISRPGDSGPKVDLAARTLSFYPEVRPIKLWFEEFLEGFGNRHPLLVVGVDTDRVRRQIQATLPQVILNAGTSDMASLRVSRHDFRHGACLSCISRADVADHPVERQLARQLGLQLDAVLALKESGEPVSTELLQMGGVLSSDQIERLAGVPLAEVQLRVCSELQLTLAPDAPAVSISFLSALAGYLLLGEVIKERTKHPRPPLNETTNHAFLSVLGRPHAELVRGWFDKRPDCDCSRLAYQRAYERKWGTVSVP